MSTAASWLVASDINGGCSMASTLIEMPETAERKLVAASGVAISSDMAAKTAVAISADSVRMDTEMRTLAAETVTLTSLLETLASAAKTAIIDSVTSAV